MIFRQLFDPQSSTYTYIVASRRGGEAIIIDPVIDHVERYIQRLDELDLRLVKALDTHIHADHISGLAKLRDCTQCATVMGENTKADVVAIRVRDGDFIDLENRKLEVIYTPGHTDDSYSFYFDDRVFTGDTLMIRGTGRTDFQNGSAEDQYDSIFSRLFKLPEETLVFPAHDYKGETVSSIAEERAFNPRLQVAGKNEYVELMANLDLAYPKMMDIAVPENLSIGLDQDELNNAGLGVCELSPTALVIDIRTEQERHQHGAIDNSVNIEYRCLHDQLLPGAALFERISQSKTPVVFCCQYGELSALGAKLAAEVELPSVRFLVGGLSAQHCKN